MGKWRCSAAQLLTVVAPLASAVLLPSLAFGQTLSVSPAAVSGASCDAGAQVTVTYNYAGDGCGQTFPCVPATANPRLLIFATQNTCPTPDAAQDPPTLPSDALLVVPLRAVTTADVMNQTAFLSVASLSEGHCGARFDATWNVCMYDFYEVPGTLSVPLTYVSATVSTQVSYLGIPPGAPSITSVSPGDGTLSVTIAPPNEVDIDHFRVRFAGGDTVFDAGSASMSFVDGGFLFPTAPCMEGSEVEVSDLDAGATSGVLPTSGPLLYGGYLYWLQAQVVDTAGQVGPCSIQAFGTPGGNRKPPPHSVPFRGCACGDPGAVDLVLLGLTLGVALGRRRRRS